MEKKRILIVDDEPDFLELIGERLSSAGYTVFKLPDGKQVFDKVKEVTPDVIILDIMMPNVDGLTIKAKLNEQEDTARIPTIFLTADVVVDDS